MIPVIYLLDQIPFKNYNVYVSDSSNLFDKASVKENQKKDWSDEHGYDIDLQSRYHNSKTITIDCFIPANSLKECIEKYNDFYNALDKKESRRLSVIAGDLRMEYQVFRQDTAENKLIYDDSNAVGTFKLKLIENMPVKRILKSYNQPFIKMFQDFYDEYLKQQIGGRNLLIKSKLIPGYIYPYDGNIIQHSTFMYNPDYISIGNNKNITFKHYKNNGVTVESAGFCITFYNKNKSFLSGSVKWEVAEGQEIITAIPPEAKYFRYTVTNINFDSKYEFGNKSTDWTPAPEDVVKSNMDFLNQISIDNILLPTEKAQFKTKVNEIKNQYNDLKLNQNISNLLQIRYNEMIAFSDFILKDLDSNSTVNSKFASITLKSKKVLVINWGDGIEEYSSPAIETYSHRYTNSEIYFPMILGDLDSITLFNTNADVLWNRF